MEDRQGLRDGVEKISIVGDNPKIKLINEWLTIGKIVIHEMEVIPVSSLQF